MLPGATIGTLKGDRVDHNWTTPSKADRMCYQIKPRWTAIGLRS